MKKANRTGEFNPPPQIEDLGDGTFYYNFDVEQEYIQIENSPRVSIDWHYSQVRIDYPVDVQKIQAEIDKQGYEHTVKLDEE